MTYRHIQSDTLNNLLRSKSGLPQIEDKASWLNDENILNLFDELIRQELIQLGNEKIRGKCTQLEFFLKFEVYIPKYILLNLAIGESSNKVAALTPRLKRFKVRFLSLYLLETQLDIKSLRVKERTNTIIENIPLVERGPQITFESTIAKIVKEFQAAELAVKDILPALIPLFEGISPYCLDISKHLEITRLLLSIAPNQFLLLRSVFSLGHSHIIKQGVEV